MHDTRHVNVPPRSPHVSLETGDPVSTSSLQPGCRGFKDGGGVRKAARVDEGSGVRTAAAAA